jgi:hypothetical protein
MGVICRGLPQLSSYTQCEQQMQCITACIVGMWLLHLLGENFLWIADRPGRVLKKAECWAPDWLAHRWRISWTDTCQPTKRTCRGCIPKDRRLDAATMSSHLKLMRAGGWWRIDSSILYWKGASRHNELFLASIHGVEEMGRACIVYSFWRRVFCVCTGGNFVSALNFISAFKSPFVYRSRVVESKSWLKFTSLSSWLRLSSSPLSWCCLV